MDERWIGFYLERIEPANDVRRFYYAVVRATMVAPVCVVRMYGRKGVWRRTLPPLVFAEEAHAVMWLEQQRRQKLRRGYVEIEGHPGGLKPEGTSGVGSKEEIGVGDKPSP